MTCNIVNGPTTIDLSLSLVHIFSTSSSRSGRNNLKKNTRQFFTLQSCAHFVGFIFQKWSEPVTSSSRYSLVPVRILSTSSSKNGPNPSVFYNLSEPVSFVFALCYIELSHSLVHILSSTFRIEAQNLGNTDLPAATADSHFTRKNTWFCAESVFSREFTRSRSLAFLNYFMMMWLT